VGCEPGQKHRSVLPAALLLTGGGLFSLAICGCAGFWDEVKSNNFEISHLFITPNPLLVLKESTDGDERARALATLHEPKQVGGTDQEQDFVVQVLTTAATSERQPWCRLKAIGSLGRFKDPRAVKGLEDAYYKASTYPGETAHAIRVQAITALGNTKNPEAVPILIRFLKQKPVEGSEQEKRENLDERIAAAHALGNFNQYQATEALAVILKSDRDVALRDSAQESLKTITGKDLPAEYAAWEEFLHQNDGKDTILREQGPLEKLAGWFSFEN
jgi:PBS lyase HEAT-like repeat